MKRLFKFKNKVSIFTIILFSVFLAVSVILGCVEPDKYIYWILVGAILLFFILMALIGYFTPILYNDKVVKYGKQEIKWADIKIVAYPIRSKSINTEYYLIFGVEYLSGEQAKQAIKQKFYVYLSAESLQVISMYYRNKLLVLDYDRTNFVDDFKVSDKLQKALFEHNSKY